MAKAGQGKAAKPKTEPKRARAKTASAETASAESSRAKSSKSSRAKSSPRVATLAAELIERVELPPPPPARADTMKLAAEVARLEFELAVARAQMVDLAARSEIDPLTDLPNRRGFERELRRSLAYVKRYGA